VSPSLTFSARRLKALEGKPEGSLVIHELYRSLQGEGTLTGLPCIFVRLTACHLRCGYCDTRHAFHSGDAFTLDELVSQVVALGDSLVQITGGEPLLQPEVHPLMTQLADAGRTVLLETSGSLDIRFVDPRVRIILDFKTPGSGEVAANLWSNVSFIKPIDEVKFVVCDRADFDWALERIREHDLINLCPVLLSAVESQVSSTELAAWILESGLPIRLQVQLHKILWGQGTRSV
jgi:7-carboxy-7-deazaguanine synthase